MSDEDDALYDMSFTAPDEDQLEGEGDGSFRLLPKGDYPCTCTSAKMGRAKKKRSPQLEMSLVVKMPDGTNQNMRAWIPIQVGFRLGNVLQSFGLPVDRQVTGRTLCDELQGRSAVAQVKIDDYTGKDKNKIERFGLATSPTITLDAFDKAGGAPVVGGGGGGSQGTPADSGHPFGGDIPMNEDEIPF